MYVGSVATIVCASVVLTSISIYGIDVYYFNFSRKIDSKIGRELNIW